MGHPNLALLEALEGALGHRPAFHRWHSDRHLLVQDPGLVLEVRLDEGGSLRHVRAPQARRPTNMRAVLQAVAAWKVGHADYDARASRGSR